jgi:hypothetical protein
MEFEKLHFDFDAVIDQENRKAIYLISGELSLLQVLVQRIPSLSCGKQFRIFVGMCQRIQAAADVLREANVTPDLKQILAWLVSADHAVAFLKAFVRVCQIQLLFLGSKEHHCHTQFTVVSEDGLSWMARLFTGIPEFVQTFQTAVKTPFR